MEEIIKVSNTVEALRSDVNYYKQNFESLESQLKKTEDIYKKKFNEINNKYRRSSTSLLINDKNEKVYSLKKNKLKTTMSLCTNTYYSPPALSATRQLNEEKLQLEKEVSDLKVYLIIIYRIKYIKWIQKEMN